MNPFQAVFLERERIEKWRACGEWMNGRAKIMEEARERKLEGARGAAGLRLGFENVHMHAALRKGNGRGQAVGSRTDDAGSANHGLELAEQQIFERRKNQALNPEFASRLAAHAV